MINDDVPARTWHRVAAVFFACLLIFLLFRACDEYRWSDWGPGDAQTMLSLHQWQRDGWLAHKLLFIPQGYASCVRALDEPPLRHHAHGIAPGTSPRVGPRLWYTHYPCGYLIPYALLYTAGLERIFFLRALSVLLSLGALILMYVLFVKIACPAVAVLAAFFYGMSGAFLGYADSLATQPVDDILRFSFMLAVVLSTRAGAPQHRKVYGACAWLIFFIMSLSSLDSILFSYVWLIGWDLLELRRFRWRWYCSFAAAVLVAGGIKLLQNAWYLGIADALTDLADAFARRGGWSAGITNLPVLFFYAATGALNALYRPVVLLVLLAVLYLLHLAFFTHRDSTVSELPSWRLLALLSACAAAFLAVVPFGAAMRYQIRQLAPAAALLAAAATWAFWRQAQAWLRGAYRPLPGTGPSVRHAAAAGHLFLFGFALVLFWHSFFCMARDPVFDRAKLRKHPDVLLAKALRSFLADSDHVIFSFKGFHAFLAPEYVPGYPQIHPIIEYYAGSRPILCFTNPEDLTSDLLCMANRSRGGFAPVLVTDDLESMKQIIASLKAKGAIHQEPSEAALISGRYVLGMEKQ
ncbi:MAG TPA: hypothetical protein VMD52_00055 [Patescibacteria group bacterium]|nr:hypothetical protein [Patescibacteria group bacterium]